MLVNLALPRNSQEALTLLLDSHKKKPKPQSE